MIPCRLVCLCSMITERVNTEFASLVPSAALIHSVPMLLLNQTNGNKIYRKKEAILRSSGVLTKSAKDC